MKKRTGYILAFTVFVLTMLFIYFGSAVLASVASLIGITLNRVNGADIVSRFFSEHINFITSLVYLIPAAVFIPWRYFAVTEHRKGRCPQKNKLLPSPFGWAVLLAFFMQHAVTLLMAFIAALMPKAVSEYSSMIESSGISKYSVMWFIATVVLPPLVEETVFRGLIYTYLRRTGMCFLAANLIQAVLFGVYHMNLVQGIYAAVLGFVMGYLVHRYKSLFISIAFHAAFNFFGSAGVSLELAVLPDMIYWWLIIISVPVSALLLRIVYNRTKPAEKEYEKGEEQ